MEELLSNETTHITIRCSSSSLLQNSSTVTLLSAVLKRTFKFFMRELAPALSTARNSVLPKLNHFWRYCVLPEVLGHWYTKKRHIPDTLPDPKAVCFCRAHNTGMVARCANTLCPIITYHFSCLKVLNGSVPKTWLCPLCHKTTKQQQAKSQDEVIEKALLLDSICLCGNKPLTINK